MAMAANKHEYPTLVDNSATYNFLRGDRNKLASYRKGVRWSLMTSTRLREPDKFSDLPTMNASDAQWIAELYRHQDRCGPFDTELPA
eukprot:7569946-Heterocapsa_arctica.AAC.1